MVKRLLITAGMATVIGLLSIQAFAQANATVGGTVSDASGAFIPGVELTATNVNTGIVMTVVSNEAGSYQFASLQPGSYKISAALPGFQTQTYENVQLSQTQQVRLNFKLEVASQAQAVEVTITADTILATTTASVGTVIRVDQVGLPLVSRNIMDLAITTPGALATGANNANTTFAGTRSSQVNTTRDGVVVSDGRYMDWNGAFAATYTTPDLVEEVQITTNTVDAEAGRGSGQVRLQTRSGTNQFHGALFYTNNNSALNAQTYFQNLAGAKKTYTNRNQYGGRLGGPIVKNKAFFFFLYEGQQYLRKEDFTANVLTESARQGIFRYLTAGSVLGTPRQNGNALGNTPSVDIKGNIKTVDENGNPLFVNSINLFSDVNDPNRPRIDPVWVAPQLIANMPKPNDYTVGDGLNLAGFRWLRPIKGSEDATGVTNNSNRNQYNTRIDYQINPKHKLFGTMSREKDTGLTGQAGIASYPNGFNGVVERRPDIYTVGFTSTLSATLLNDFRYGLRRTSFYGWGPIHVGCCSGSSDTDVDELGKKAVASLPTINGYLLNINSGAPATLTWAGAGALNNTLGSPIVPYGTGATRGSMSPLWSFSDTASWIRGAHSFKGGAELIFANSDGWNTGNNDAYPRATLGIGNFAPPISAGSNGTFPALHANDVTPAQNVMSLLAGTVQQVTQGFFINSPTATAFDDYKKTIRRARDIHENDWSVFFKDNWKVTQNFTMNLGLRYERYGTPWEAHGLAGHAKGGQAGLFGISGTNFNSLWNPFATGGSLTTIELIGDGSPNPNIKPYAVDKNNFAPSLGFSWNLPHLHNTVLRGGYGINYTGAPTFLSMETALAALPGTDNLTTFTPSVYTNLSSVQLPLTATLAPLATVPVTDRTVSFAGFDDSRAVPYVQNFNLSIQRELARNLTIDVSYSGTKGTKLWSPIQLNEVNIFENGILQAFNITRAGGSADLFNRMLNGFSVTGVGITPGTTTQVNGTTFTGSDLLRKYSVTNIWVANGDVANLANWINTNTNFGARGAMLTNAGLPQNYVTVNPQFGSLVLHGNNDNSTYHSLVTQVRKRLSNGVTGEFAYTWSKSLGNTVIPAGVGTDTTSTTRDPRNRSLQKGFETFDRKHTFNTFGAWDLPFGPNRRFLSQAPSIVQRFVEGWQVSGIFNWSSGSPLGFQSNIRTLSCASGCGANTNINTPDLVGVLPDGFGNAVKGAGFVTFFPTLKVKTDPFRDSITDATVKNRLTNQVITDAAGNIILQNPQPGTTGNLSQRTFEGPGNLRMDAALTKRMKIGESKSFTIRADAVNLLNRPVWGDPNLDINNSAQFGRITTATGSRTITFGARVDF